jgi:GT2 family glycosyltransferase
MDERTEGLVSIVILTWNSRCFLPDCITSVQEQTHSACELIVMDNASQDDSVAWTRRHCPAVRVIANPTNLGFAKAHNKGIRETSGTYYIPLNPDVILKPHYVARLVESLEEESDVGSVCGKTYFLDATGEPTRRLYSTGHLLTKNRKPSNRGYKRKDRGQFEQREYVFGVNGACPIYRRAMLEDVAVNGEYFDETFFLYGDDYDLGWRAQLLGWKSLYVPEAVAYHVGQGSGGLDTPHVQFQYARNRYLEIYKNDLARHFLIDLPYILIYELLWQAYTLVTDPRRSLAHLKAVIDFIRLLPKTHQVREEIQARRRVTPGYVRSLFTGMVLR